MTGQCDAELAEKAAAGNRDAFATLLARHYDLIFRVAWKWTGNRADAEDVAQDVCIKLGRAIRTFDGRAAFTSWLYQVTLNTVRDRARAEQRQKARLAELAIVTEKITPAADQADPLNELWSAVRQLPDTERDAVLLVYAEGKTQAEAGKVLGCAEGTVAWRISKAKKQLKRHLVSETL